MEINNSMFMNKILNYKQNEAKKNNENNTYKNTLFEDDFDEIL